MHHHDSVSFVTDNAEVKYIQINGKLESYLFSTNCLVHVLHNT